jgi:hypothetical protein
MIQIIAFYPVVVIATILVGWAFLSPYTFPVRPGWTLCLTGAVILMASLLLLPWITADPPDVRAENLAWLKSKPNPWWSARAIIAIREKRIPNPLEAFDLKGYLCDTPRRERWYMLLENHTSLSAWQLLLKAPTFSLMFTASLWGRLVLSTGALLTGMVLPFLGLEDRGGLTRKVLGGLAAILLVLALFQIPGADTLGLRQEFKLDYINLLAGVRINGGMWWSLAGLAAIVVGLLVEEVDLL